MADDTKTPEEHIENAKSIAKSLAAFSGILSQFIDPISLSMVTSAIILRDDFTQVLKNKKSYPFTKGDGTFDDEVLGDVAFNVAITHAYYTTTIKDPNQKFLMFQKLEYLKHVEDVVVENSKMRQLLNYNQQITGLNHTPMLYICLALTEQLLSKVKDIAKDVQYFKKEKQFVYSCFDKMIRTTKSIVTILADEDYYNAYTLLRTLIEALCTYLTLVHNRKAINEYEKFLKFNIDYENSGSKEYPQDFLELYDKYKGLKVSKTSFLNYGWLMVVDPDNTMFNFESVFNHVQDEEFKKDKSLLHVYKFCSKFVHANLYGFISTDDSVFALSLDVGSLLLKISNLFCDTFGEECMCEDINLIDCLKKRLDEHKIIMSHMTQTALKK